MVLHLVNRVRGRATVADAVLAVDDHALDPAGAAAVGGPPIPLGRRIRLLGRGTSFVRVVAGPAMSRPPAAPTVLLLHGWLASGGLNWFRAFDSLGEHFAVVAPDLRGHGRGIRSRRRFTLADCADDAAALCDALGTGPVIAVGYSMGGPVAQLLWRRHPHLVRGLVLCATSHHLVPGAREQAVLGTLMAATAGTTRVGQVMSRIPGRHLRSLLPFGAGPGARPSSLQAWAGAEMRRHDWRHVAEAGWALSNFRAPWIGEVDVPTAVLVTTRDRAVAPLLQLRTARAIDGATVHRLAEGHTACTRPSFGPALLAACRDVAGRDGVVRT